MDKGMLNGLGERFARCAEHAGTVALYIGDRINRPAPTGLDGTPFQQLRKDLEEMRMVAETMERSYAEDAFDGVIRAVPIKCHSFTADMLASGLTDPPEAKREIAYRDIAKKFQQWYPDVIVEDYRPAEHMKNTIIIWTRDDVALVNYQEAFDTVIVVGQVPKRRIPHEPIQTTNELAATMRDLVARRTAEAK